MTLKRFLTRIFHQPVYAINWIAYAQQERSSEPVKALYPDASKQVRKNAKALEKKRAEWREAAYPNVVRMAR